MMIYLIFIIKIMITIFNLYYIKNTIHLQYEYIHIEFENYYSIGIIISITIRLSLVI